jgi:hypothetical protein
VHRLQHNCQQYFSEKEGVVDRARLRNRLRAGVVTITALYKNPTIAKIPALVGCVLDDVHRNPAGFIAEDQSGCAKHERCESS